MSRSVLVVAVAVAAMTICELPTQAQDLGQEHRPPVMMAMSPCMMVATPAQRSSIHRDFQQHRQRLTADHRNLMDRRHALTQAILSGDSTKVKAQESAVMSAAQKLLQDQDAFEVAICQKLSPTQLSAAQKLFSTLVSLHQQFHSQMQKAVQSAQHAANPAVQSSGGQMPQSEQ
ncbi:MAG TPA: hypothetical protein VKV28_01620 [Candidatus Binataceae bacterium]|nr:hypothetical protein [Candidatus Binataceae bacterium]